MPRRHAGPEDGDLLGGRSIHHATTALDLLADVRRGRALRRAFEHHVLEEVARACVLLRLDARADADVDRRRDGPRLGHLGYEDPEAVGQRDVTVLQAGGTLAAIGRLRPTTPRANFDSAESRSGLIRLRGLASPAPTLPDH